MAWMIHCLEDSSLGGFMAWRIHGLEDSEFGPHCGAWGKALA